MFSLHALEDLAQRQARLPCNPRAILVLRREHRGLAVLPAELALHRAPACLDRARLAVELVPLGGIAANAQGAGLAEKNVVEDGQGGFRGDDAQERAGAV